MIPLFSSSQKESSYQPTSIQQLNSTKEVAGVNKAERELCLSATLNRCVIMVLEAFVFATILCGFFGIIFKRNLLMKIISMDVMSTGVITYYVLVASKDGLLTPIVSDIQDGAYADPVPQAVILTAIVIGFSILALMLVGIMKLSRDNPTLETDEIEKDHTP
jgi:multicomponent Na+:H+ antiporter subunit C